jgi:integrase
VTEAAATYRDAHGSKYPRPLPHSRSSHRDAIEHRIAIHATTTARQCPSLHAKKVTAHVLRHTTAMRLLHAGVDIAVIALWLGHGSIEATCIYCSPTSRSKNEHSPAHQVDTGHRTTSSAGSKPSDYADLASTNPLPARDSVSASA